jgi:hypothetical protein
MSAHAPYVALLIASIGFSAPAFADQTLVRALAESNVNQQYLIESVSISGVEVAHFHDRKLPPSLRQRLVGMVGAPCDMTAIGDLAGRLRSTLHLQDVKQHLSRGSSPDRVRVDFEVIKRPYAFDLSVPRFLFHSKQGWTTEVNASARVHEHSVSVGLGSNGDDLIERFAGFSTRYDNSRLFSDRVRFGIGFESWHDQWNPATRDAIQTATLNQLTPGASNAFALYRARRNIAPAVTVSLTRELSLSVGTSFEKMDMEPYTVAPSQMSQNANAATVEVNFTRAEEGETDQQRWDGKYSLRVATHELGSDYVYTRQFFSIRYEWKPGRYVVTEHFIAGNITGNAPLFERFALGNSSTLRGWDRYAIDPLGGDRMVHNSVTCGRQIREGTAEVFYDAGMIGNGDKMGTTRHSVGVGFRQGIFTIAMAFPIVQGRMTPVFMAGMNY